MRLSAANGLASSLPSEQPPTHPPLLRSTHPASSDRSVHAGAATATITATAAVAAAPASSSEITGTLTSSPMHPGAGAVAGWSRAVASKSAASSAVSTPSLSTTTTTTGASSALASTPSSSSSPASVAGQSFFPPTLLRSSSSSATPSVSTSGATAVAHSASSPSTIRSEAQSSSSIINSSNTSSSSSSSTSQADVPTPRNQPLHANDTIAPNAPNAANAAAANAPASPAAAAAAAAAAAPPRMVSPTTPVTPSHSATAAPALVNMSAPVNSNNLFQVKAYFGVSVAELLSGAGEKGPTLPRILVFLCEYMMRYVEDVAQERPAAFEAELRVLFQQNADEELFARARQRFNHGDFFDCDSPIIAFRLLRAFVREMPTPLMPPTMYDDAIHLVQSHLRRATSLLRRNKHYTALLAGFPESTAAEVDDWVKGMFHNSGLLLQGGIPISEESVIEVVKPLQAVLTQLAFSVCAPFSDLEELFFSMPRANKDALEYLGVFFVKMDLSVRRVTQSSESPSLLMQDLAGIFAPYLLRPSLWTNADASEKQRTRVVQRSFLLHFLFFVKKKHNLMTRSERTSMDSTEDELVDDLLLRAIPASARFNMAFASTFASAPSVPPSLSASLVSSGTTGASHFHPTGQSFGAASAVTDPGSEGSDNDDDNDLENVSQSRTTTRRNSLRSMTSTTSSVKAPKFVKHAFVEVWVDALPTAPSVLSAPLQRLVPADRLRQPEATPSSEQSSVRLVPFLVAENTHMGRVALGESSLSLDAAASHAVRALDFDTKRKKRHLQRRGTATSLASVKSKSAAGLLIRVQGPVPTFITPDSEIPFRGSFVHPEGFVVLPRQASPTPPNLPSLNNSNNHRSQTSDGGTNGTNGAIGGGEPGSYLALPDALPPHLRKTRPRASFSKVSAAFSRDPHDEDWGLGPIEHPASVVMESTSETNPRAAVVEASLVQAHASGALLLDPYMEANEAATADDSGDASDDSENEDDSPVAEDASMNEQVDQSYSTSPALTASAASREETYSNGSTDDHIHHLISLDSTEEAAAKRAAQKQSTIPQSHPVDDGDQSTLPAFSVLSHEQTDAQLQPALAEHSTPNLPAASGARVKTIRRPALETLSESVSARGIVQLDWVQDASTKARTAFLQDSPSIARWLQAPILQGDPELMPNFDLVVFGGIGATGMESEALYDKKATARMQRYSGSFGVHFEAPGRGLVHLVTNIGHSELPLSSNESAREQDRAWGSSSEVMDHLRNRSTSVKTTNSVQFSVHIGEGAAVLASGAVETDSLSALEPQLAAVAEDLDTTLTGSLSQSIASLDSLVSLEAAPPVVVVSSLAPREHPDETSSSQSPEQQPSPLPELLLKQADEQQNAPPHDLQPHPHTEAVERPADHTSPSPKSPAADFKRPSVMVANYDNAMAFPRTHALYAGDRLQAESDIVQFFLSFASQVRKAEFIYDQQSDLLNQKLPRLHDGSRCENCGAGITTLSFSRKGRRSHCGYCGRLLCSACCDRNFVIPARIVQRGDLTPHVVCQACEAHLQCHLYAPLIELNALSAEAILEIGRTKVETMLEDCAMLMRYIYYHVLPACPSRQLLLSLLPSRIVPLLLVYQDSVGARISLADLCELPTRQFAEIIHAYRQLFGHHVQYCKHCSQLKRECCAKELCTRPPHSTTPTPVSTASPSAPSSGSTLLDPTAKSTELMLCPRCMQYCHVECWRAVESQCLACAAKPQTNVRLILPAEAPQNFGLSARNRLAGAAVSVPTLVGATAAAPSTSTAAAQAEAPDSARSSTTLSIASVPATQASDSQARRGSLASAGDGGDAPSLASTLSPSQRSSLQQFNVASPTPSLLAAQPHSFNPSVEGVDLSTLPGETLLWDVAVHDFFSAA